MTSQIPEIINIYSRSSQNIEVLKINRNYKQIIFAVIDTNL
jgi:hypothetical protein